MHPNYLTGKKKKVYSVILVKKYCSPFIEWLSDAPGLWRLIEF